MYGYMPHANQSQSIYQPGRQQGGMTATGSQHGPYASPPWRMPTQQGGYQPPGSSGYQQPQQSPQGGNWWNGSGGMNMPTPQGGWGQWGNQQQNENARMIREQPQIFAHNTFGAQQPTQQASMPQQQLPPAQPSQPYVNPNTASLNPIIQSSMQQAGVTLDQNGIYRNGSGQVMQMNGQNQWVMAPTHGGTGAYGNVRVDTGPALNWEQNQAQTDAYEASRNAANASVPYQPFTQMPQPNIQQVGGQWLGGTPVGSVAPRQKLPFNPMTMGAMI